MHSHRTPTIVSCRISLRECDTRDSGSGTRDSSSGARGSRLTTLRGTEAEPHAPPRTPGDDRMSGCRPAVRPRVFHCAVKLSHDTLECQFENVPVGLSFHAQTC